MKKVGVICAAIIVVLLILTSNQDRLLIMRVMNQAASLSSGSSGSNWFGTSANSRNVGSGNLDPNTPLNPGYNPAFVPAGMNLSTGKEFNYLELLYQVQQGGGTVTYANGAELIEFYTHSSNGNFDPVGGDWEQHAPPQYIAAVHGNETNYGIWGGGTPAASSILGSQWNGQTVRVDNMNETMIRAVVGSGSGSLWKDNGNDGYPDGPFQIEKANPSGRGFLSSQTSTTGTFDVFSFRDCANFLHDTWNKIFKRYGQLASGRELGALSGLIHNKGSLWQFVYGLPYWTDGKGIDGQHANRIATHRSEDDELTKKRAVALVKEVISSWDTCGVDLFTTLEHRNAMSALLLLRKGWYLDGYMVQMVEPQIDRFIDSFGDDNNHPMRKMFANETFENREAMKQFVKSRKNNLYDVLVSKGYNLTKAQVDEIYGTRDGYYRNSFSYHNTPDSVYSFLFKVEDAVAEGVYTKADEMGIKVPFVYEFDVISVRYIIDTGISMDGLFVELALKSGMANVIGGKSIDPSNPTFFYGGDIGFDPVYGDGYETIESVYQMLGYGENDVHPLAKVFMLSIWTYAGGPYTQTGGNQFFNAARWAETTGGNVVGSKGYWTLYGSSSSQLLNSKWQWEPAYETMLANDCSRLVKVGLVLGNPDLITKTNTPSNTSELYGRISDNGSSFSCSEVEYNGQSYNATLYQVDGNGKLMASFENGVVTSAWFSTDSSYSKQGKNEWASYLQPGDILVRQGHTEAFFGVNKTGSTVTIPPEMTKRRWENNARAATVPTMQAVYMAHNGSDGHSGLHSAATAAGFDDYKNRYYALRPAYLIPGLDSPGFTCP